MNPPPLPSASGQVYPQKTSALAIWSLVLGILGLTCFTIFTGIPGLICGHMALSRIKRSGGTLGGQGLAIAGTIMGYMSLLVLPMLMIIAVPNFMRARATAQRNVCIMNLKRIDAAKQKWAMENKKQAKDVPTEQDLAPYLGTMPICPNGGTYSINENDQNPTCTVPGHDIQ